jgi:photosystem II stability/assembly factor-like uncharacterized protein
VSIPVPNLDDRAFGDLVTAGRERIQQIDPEWTDLSAHDPGTVLLEAFAHLTDLLLYRLNRVPERLYAVYLNLLGTSLRPPSAASTTLRFTRTDAKERVRIVKGTRVGCPPGLLGVPQPVFVTLAEAVLDEGVESVEVPAGDLTLHEAVLIGTGTGQPGQSFTLPGAPLVDGPGVTVAIEVAQGRTLAVGDAVMVGDRAFRTCRELQIFADAAPDEAVVKIDRSSGTVSFAWFTEDAVERPSVPEAGAQIVAWYLTGGGERGNVRAGQVTVPRDPLPAGIKVTNPEAATGGRDGESLDNALRRAPQEFQARDRAVTARDYEVLASRHGGVARARAMTRREVWAYAAPGEVEVVLVPHVPEADRPRGAVRMEALQQQARPEVRTEVEAFLRERATIGAEPVIRWARYKQVLVDARVVVRPDEDIAAVRERILRRLASTINPLPQLGADFAAGFGRPLRVSNLYRILEQAEPGVLYVERVRLELELVPDADAIGLVRAEGQDNTWFVGQQGTLFRTTNGAAGWEAVATLDEDEVVRAIAPYPAQAAGRAQSAERPGLIALATDVGTGARVYVSKDLGGSWDRVAELGFGLADLTWVDRAGTPVLLVAGERGLYELSLAPGAVPVQNLVDPGQPELGFHAVASFVDVRGRAGVMVAAEASSGVWLSADAGEPETFRQVKPGGEDIRCLTVQYDGPAVVVWAGRAVPEGDGIGCLRLRVDELSRGDLNALTTRWEDLRRNWTGGSCWAVEVFDDRVYAATQSGGVLSLALGEATPSWVQPDVNCGLPLRDRRRFQPVTSLSGRTTGDESLLLAAGPYGVHRAVDRGARWRTCSARVVDDVVTAHESWLFCSGEHRVEVVRSG